MQYPSIYILEISCQEALAILYACEALISLCHLSLCRTKLKSWGPVTITILSIAFQGFSEVTINTLSRLHHQATDQQECFLFSFGSYILK